MTAHTYNNNDLETQPLLAEDGSKPELRSNKRNNNNKPKWARWMALCSFGILFLFLFNLVFLPRTSVNRDWRRLHHLKVTYPELERSLFQSISADSIRDWSKEYTAERHLAGENYPLVQWTKDKFEEYGIKAKVEQYDVYLNKPYDRYIKLLDEDGEVKYTPKLEEDEIEEDESTTLPESERVPTFHGYSASGNVTGQYVYANYGLREDFERLEANGIDLKDKIAIVRYNRIFRGSKVMLAQEKGASAVLIYSDPGDDPFSIYDDGVKAYPEGPARHPSSVQRGSVQFLSLLPGDPTTPGYASKGDVDRVDPHGSTPSIPSIPVSFQDILPILKELNGKGPRFDDDGDRWVGGLKEYDYSVGPSGKDSQLNVMNLQDYDIRPIYNVIGHIEGVVKDEAIVIGNHRDSWIAGGAGDPNSGSAAMIELAKAFGQLKKIGWKPMRSIILASWDGEEYGLLGSTEWGEDKAKYLDAHCLAYINVDVACSGPYFSAKSSPLLFDLIKESTSRVSSPDGNGTLFDYWERESGAHINILGSGSDFTVFQDHIGIPSVDLGFKPGGSSPIYHYHSNYDSFHWMDNFGDPEWKYHDTLTKFWGLLTLSLSETEVIPFKATDYGKLLYNQVSSLEQELSRGDNETHVFSKLKDELSEFIDQAKEYDEYTRKLQDEYTRDYPWYKWYIKVTLLFKIKITNFKLFKIERAFLYDEGLDDRSWFKHIVFAPDRELGYTGALLPGLTEAVEDYSLERIIKWSEIISTALKKAKKLL